MGWALGSALGGPPSRVGCLEMPLEALGKSFKHEYTYSKFCSLVYNYYGRKTLTCKVKMFFRFGVVRRGRMGVPNVRGSLKLLNLEFKVRVQFELWTLLEGFSLDSSWTIELSNLEFKFVESWTLELGFQSSSSWNSELNPVWQIYEFGLNANYQTQGSRVPWCVNYWTLAEEGGEFGTSCNSF